MGILLVLKEGKVSTALESGVSGSGFVKSFPDGFRKEDTDGISLAFRMIMEALSTTNTSTAQKARAIVMGDS
mgnify:CR=1 FL=1|tara:strand:+ start:6875 stop:7090 length:216 start_codon:yes stop_codon:yes gene_type:complete